MARGFRRKGETYAARLDAGERSVVSGLMQQVLELVAPDLPEGTEPRASGRSAGSEAGGGAGDDFDEIVAGLGGIGLGVSVAAEDQVGDRPRSAGDLAGIDPALQRLLPTANREDEQAADEFRRMTERSLRTHKAHNLRTSIDALESARDNKLVLTAPQALAMVVALTDVRLVLGERLGLRNDDDAERLEELVSGLDQDDPTVYALAIYDFLTWLQETLSQALLPG